jgi:hypothetical protein
MPSTLRRPAVLIPIVGVGLLVLIAGLYLFQPWRLVTNVTVDEALPTPVSSPQPIDTRSDAPTTTAAPPASASPADATTAPIVLAEGSFISHEHGTTGTVRILELADGSRILRLAGLDTSNGPDLKVWLTDAPVLDGKDGWFVFDDGAYVDLGSLKGNRGNQNYPIPADLDLEGLSSVAIWCDRFNVSFGAAELQPA